MSVVILLILASLMVGLLFLGAFIWSVRSGQYEDILTPSMRVLADDSTSNETIDFGFNAPCAGAIGDYVWNDANRDGIQQSNLPVV